MFRFFLRLFLLMAAAIVVAVLAVPLLLERTYTKEADAYYNDAVRGQFYTLVEQFKLLTPSQREQHLATITPHYGLALALVDPRTFAATDRERTDLRAGRFIARNDQTEYLVPIPAVAHADEQWLRVELPDSPVVSGGTWTATILVIALIVAAFLLVWVWPTWRDLERLEAAARKMGAGDLGARADVSSRSNVRRLADDVNQMIERIGGLIERQRELTNAVSHELRTPIARLSFELDLLANESDAAARETLVGAMRDDLRELDALITELLAYARLERHDDRTPPQIVDARAWLADAVASVAREAAAAGIACRIADGAPTTVALYPRYMTRALVNLLRNAVRYAASTIEIGLVRERDGGYALHVGDDGPGIAPEHRRRVFEPFTRVDESRDRATGGFGLGLAIVERIAQRHGGSVDVGDDPLGGARLVIRWRDDT